MEKIVIDARMIESTGIGVYTSNVISRLPVDCGFELSLMGGRKKLARFSLPVHQCSAPIYSVREQAEVPLILKNSGCDLYHATHYNVPALYSGRMVVTIYDLIHILYPAFLPFRAAFLYAQKMFGLAVRKADRIITISEHTKRDLVKHLGVDEAKIRLVYPAVGHEFIPSSEAAAEMRAKYGRYILYIGAVRSHKNVMSLVQAFCELKKNRGIEQKLVVAGKGKGDYLNRLKLYISANGLENEFIHVEGPDFGTVKDLYRGADVFVFPSLYEGFGLPVLEAMGCGCPVICSNTSSLPEAGGDAALMVDPKDVRALSDALLTVLAEGGLRDEMISRGFTHIKRFSWEKAAEQTLQVYKEILRER